MADCTHIALTEWTLCKEKKLFVSYQKGDLLWKYFSTKVFGLQCLPVRLPNQQTDQSTG